MKTIFIIDLHAGLIEDYKQRKGGINGYKYRGWLIEQHLKNCFTILVTNREMDEQAAFIRHIYEQTGWIPNDWYFLPSGANRRIWKRTILLDHIFPKYGGPYKQEMVALDTQATSNIYARYGINPLWIEEDNLMQDPDLDE